MEKITQLVLRDVQYGASLNKNKKYLEENFDKIKCNLQELHQLKTSAASLDSQRVEPPVQLSETRKQLLVPQAQMMVNYRPESTRNTLAQFLTLDDEVMLDDKDLNNYAPDSPNLNKVSSGLLAMNKARADRCSHHLSRQNSFASHTATVSNDIDHDE